MMYALDKEQARLLPSPLHSRTLPTFKRYGVANYGVYGAVAPLPPFLAPSSSLFGNSTRYRPYVPAGRLKAGIIVEEATAPNPRHEHRRLFTSYEICRRKRTDKGSRIADLDSYYELAVQ
jgi:hypothetical protein